MVTLGFFDEAYPGHQYERREDGLAVPAVDFETLTRARNRRVRQVIDAATTAETVGYDYVVHPERHFGVIGSSSPAPLLLQSHLASATSEVRLLQMANTLPLHEPVRLAERISTLDVLSEGRLDVGLTHGASEVSASVLGSQWGASDANDRKNDVSYREKLAVMKHLWDPETTGYPQLSDAAFHTYPAGEPPGGAVVTPPVQRPHPPLWKPTMRPHSLRWAARNGFNGCAHVLGADELRQQVSTYHDHLTEVCDEPVARGWDADRRTGIAPVVQVFDTTVATESDLRQWKRGTSLELSDPDDYVPPDETVERLADADNPIVGPPERIARRISDLWDAAGYDDHVCFVSFTTKGLGHDAHLRQIESFAENTAPLL